MADKDTITKEYMQDNETFADAFNFLLYNGEQVIKPERLKSLDTTTITPKEISDEDFAKFHTELKEVLKYVKYSKDKANLYRILHDDEV